MVRFLVSMLLFLMSASGFAAGKYPNGYEHFQGLGFDLETGPKIFDGIYTGTEMRDLINGEEFSGKEEGTGWGGFGMGGSSRMAFPLKLSPHSYRFFRAVPAPSKAP